MFPNGKIRRLISEEAGQSLLLAIIIIAALTITTAGVITFMGSNETSAGRDREVVRSLSGAEAGLSNGISTIVQSDAHNTLPVPSTLSGSTKVDGAQVDYTLTKSSTTDSTTTPPTTTFLWTINSTGSYGAVSRTVQQQVKYIQGVHQDASVDYKYGLFVGAPPAGTNPPCLITLSGDVTVSASVYVGGNLCSNGGVTLKPKTAHQLSVYVKGYWNGNGGGSIGQKAPPIPFAIARVQGGCLNNQGNSVICSNQTNVFADDTNTTPFPDLQKPTVHPDTIYNAAPSWVMTGSNPVCSGGFVLDNGPGVMDGSVVVNGGEELFPNHDYTCSVPKTDGTTATMSWDSTNNIFNITGTMFIDGDVSIQPTGSADINWTGNGAIYVNGVLNKGSNNNLCGPPIVGSGPPTGIKVTQPCAHTWDTTAGNFGFVVLNPANAANGYDASGNGELDMDMYVVSGFANNGGTVVTGSVIADGGTIGGGSGFLNPANPPPDFPITYDLPDIGWNATPSTWKELK